MKRYKLGQRRTKTDSHGNSATMPDMIECDKGEYIKYSEYEQLLESIGAGGVGGQGVTQVQNGTSLDEIKEAGIYECYSTKSNSPNLSINGLTSHHPSDDWQTAKGEQWGGWACQYPGMLPRIYGSKNIAELNHHPDEGDRLIYLSEMSKYDENKTVKESLTVDHIPDASNMMAQDAAIDAANKEG